MTITVHRDLIQGSDEWAACRTGLLTASEVKHILTPTLKLADNEKTRTHVWELAAQRISQYVEPSYIGDDMLRGWEDEVLARAKYEEVTGRTVDEVGFITNDKWGFTIGYSPDGCVGTDGGIECKSRRQKFQVQTIVEWHRDKVIPTDYLLQVQTGLLVAEWEWLDLVSYSGGLHMPIMRVYPDAKIQEAIVAAASVFEAKVRAAVRDYGEAAVDMVLTERKIEQEMFVGEMS
mgnify:CR=1 FL=1